jgi:integrase/recombinase XerD
VRRADLDPLEARGAHLELYVRRWQEVRSHRLSTVSRRTSVVCGFYVPASSTACSSAHRRSGCVARASRPGQLPSGWAHLQFEGVPAAARDSANVNNFALVAMLGLLGLRIFGACTADTTDLGEENGHRFLRVVGKAPRSWPCLSPRPWPGRSTGPSTAGTPGRSSSTGVPGGWTATPPPDDSATSTGTPVSGCRGCTRTCSGTPFVTTMLDAGVDLRDVLIAAPARRPADHHALRPRTQRNLDRHPNGVLAAFMASGS